MSPRRHRSSAEVEDPAAWRSSKLFALVKWIHHRRPILTAGFVVAVLVLAFRDPAPPAEMLPPRTGVAWLAWVLVLVGVGVRLWGAGNLRKSREITRTGVYQLLRHPLYFGSLCVFLAFFLTVGNPWAGAAMFAAMVVAVYYPTMLGEEAHLASNYPDQAAGYGDTPRLVPDFRAFPRALRSDRFTLEAAASNLGLRSLWAIPGIPLLLEVMRWMEAAA